MNLRVRRAVAADAEAYVHTHVAAQISAYQHLMPPEYAEDRLRERPRVTADLAAELERLTGILAAGEEPFRHHWVVELDDRIVGIACAGLGMNWWEEDFDPPPADIPWILDRLYLLPEAHGTGAGQALFDVAVGDRSAYLWIIADNHRAERFYRRNGFSPDGAEGETGPIWYHRRMFRMVRRA